MRPPMPLRRPRITAGAVVAIALATVAGAALSILAGAVLVMVAMGILHSVFVEVPAISYVASVAVTLALSLIRVAIGRGN